LPADGDLHEFLLMDYLVPALQLVLQVDTLLAVLLASLFGFVVGALPGLTATMAVALLVPITFLLSPLAAVASIVAASAMAIYAGDIPGALLRIPGTPASAAYVEEAHKLTLKGRGGYALAVNATCSMIGGVVGTAVLILAAPLLADVALKFSVFEFFWLSFLGLSCGAFVAGDAPLKGGIAMLIGLLISTVGMEYSSGFARFTFDNPNLLEGVSFIPALIGMFALPEILRSLLKGADVASVSGAEVKDDWKGAFRSIFRYRRVVLRSSTLGTVIGILPGAGADIASWISVAIAKRFSRERKQWGTGHVEGLVAGSSANNAALGGAWIPAMVFAIPGDTITAIAIGVLYLKGMNPGPAVFIDNADLVYAVFLVFMLANLLLLPFGWIAVRLAKIVLGIPRDILMPALLILAIVGAFAIDNDFSGVWIMLALGVIAYVLEESGFPIAPIVLGIVLGKLVERNLVQSMISTQGDLLGFFERPISAILGVLTIAIWGWALLRWMQQHHRAVRA
jgi:TctA family transporter